VEDRIEERLTERHAVFEVRELRTVALEQTAGELTPHHALQIADGMIRDRRILTLEGGRMTTLAIRAQEQAIERRTASLARRAGRDVGHPARTSAARNVAERIGSPLTAEQARALLVLTGPERAAALVGPAGTGKGVVLDATARAEHLAGRTTLGIAVSGSTAERLGTDSPVLQGQTLTLDALIARADTGGIHVGPDTTVILDEAGMADHKRLDALTGLVEHTGAKLIAVGDGKQLASIGPGGMFDRLTQHAPVVELETIHRTKDPEEQRAWQALRAGEPERAMAHYQARGRLHLADTRDQAAENAVQTWAQLTEHHDIRQVALIATPPTRRSTGSTPARSTSAPNAANSAPMNSHYRAFTTDYAKAITSRSSPSIGRLDKRESRTAPAARSRTSAMIEPLRSRWTAQAARFGSPARMSSPCDSRTRSMSTASRARPSIVPSCSPAAGRPARRPPTSKPPEPATAPIGTLPVTSSARKATIPSESPYSPGA
jgi:hypothetical protein